MDPVEGRRAPVDDITILHVDDNAELCRLTSEILARETDGIETITEGTVSDGLARLDDTEGIDCVVSDYELPDRTGIEFLEAVRREHADLPFILFTGKGSEAVASEAIAAGATDYLRKQVGTQQYDLLANRVRNAVAQYRSERERRRNERRFKAVFEDPEMHVGLLDPDGTVVRTNRTALEFVGADQADVAGEPFWETPWWNHSADLQADLREWIERAASGEYVSYETDHLDSTNATYRVSGTIRPVTDADGDVESLIASAREVSTLQKRERRLARLHEATRDLVEAASSEAVAEITTETADDILDLHINAVHLADRQGEALVPTAVSDSSRELIGDPPVLDSGLAWQAYHRGVPEVYSDVTEHADVYDTDTPIRSEMYLPLGEHGVFTVSSPQTEAFDETDVMLAKILAANAETALDRTVHERSLERTDAYLEEFTSAVSHDLRNPLNVATGRLELARQDRDDEHLEAVAQALDRTDTLIDDLLALAREGDTALDVEPTAIADVARSAWQTVETGDAALSVETGLAIEADRHRLTQLLENLFSNAVEHGDENVTVTVGSLTDRSGFYVADDGVGIPVDDSDVFERGYSTSEDGTGFGLTIVEQIAAEHDWTVTAAESADGGARFDLAGVEIVANGGSSAAGENLADRQ